MPAVALVTVAIALGSASAAVAVPAPVAMPSDPRAEFVSGDAVTCSDVGFDESIRIGGAGSEPGADAYVAGTTRQDRYLDVAITPDGVAAGVVIDAVVVKGGNGFNLYTDPAVLPPSLAPPQGYFSPLVGAGNIPQISHWFVCYHLDPLPTGSLLIEKEVIPPAGLPAQSLPLSFSVLVTCDAPGFEPVVITFGRSGGVALNAGSVLIDALPTGTTCTVEEEGTASLPPGTVVSFSPDSTVQIGDAAGAEVTVTNDFTGISVLQGSLTITKAVQPAVSPADLPAEWIVEYACLDGTVGTVALPAAGGTSAPIMVTAGTYCAIAEATTSVPPGWTVTYQSGDQISATGLTVPVFEAPVDVTVTNTPPTPVPSPSPSPGPGTPSEPDAPELAASGAPAPVGLAVAGAAALLSGAVAAACPRRRGRAGR
ncbi:DUF5979 domain-containing protein [Microbacterium timonense]|uniref:DUF5979 domain-containing protein n=1 Tax=Microbacterium timonense TaxID=2086576 RepID=UPI000D114E4D|nr:DUF5979 domain-containing protein [Microbacterium timonense]